MPCIVISLFFLCFTVPGPTDDAPRPQTSRAQSQTDQIIRVSSHLVLVPVSVTDAEGRIVTDLGIDDFRIEENAKPVPIAKIGEPGETALELALLFDISGSLHGRFELERDAAAGYLKMILRPSDAVSLWSVGSQPRIIQRRTTSLSRALAGLQTVTATEEATALYDSIVAAAKMLRGTSNVDARRVLLVLSDGEDNRSEENQLPDAVVEVQRSDCLFYSVNPSGRSIRMNKLSLRGQHGLEALAAETGGAAFVVDKSDDLNSIYARIAEELRAQYLLGYYSPDPRTDGSFQKIAVRVPARPDLRIRARQGYYAIQPEQPD